MYEADDTMAHNGESVARVQLFDLKGGPTNDLTDNQLLYVDGRRVRMTLHPDIPAKDADSVTHYICPDSPQRGGVPDATHHLVPRRAGRTADGEPAFKQECSYCGKSEADLRAILFRKG